LLLVRHIESAPQEQCVILRILLVAEFGPLAEQLQLLYCEHLPRELFPVEFVDQLAFVVRPILCDQILEGIKMVLELVTFCTHGFQKGAYFTFDDFTLFGSDLRQKWHFVPQQSRNLDGLHGAFQVGNFALVLEVVFQLVVVKEDFLVDGILHFTLLEERV